ncbi:hypothetical protein H8356DRAFT_1360595 [Neocallimastix lanati (nom. inval.)]|nr:hypothetical protein H8356DRAFT_1360595 [Neocallimastix sp. JGI-2020a]
MHYLVHSYHQKVNIVTLAEWLTRWPAKPFPFGSAGSSPAGDENDAIRSST